MDGITVNFYELERALVAELAQIDEMRHELDIRGAQVRGKLDMLRQLAAMAAPAPVAPQGVEVQP